MELQKFCVAGINYKRTEAELRSLFAIGEQQHLNILSAAASFGVKELFILSTCNRTEIYGIAESAENLIDLLCLETPGHKNLFLQSAYIKTGREAIEHIFNVGAGLDSQILGDYEIIGQLKNAAKFSRQHGCLGTHIERLINAVLQASKQIKNKTSLSGGTVSVSFAAVQYIKKKVSNVAHKHILLLGTGKIGSNTCKNLVDYIGTKNITLINRSQDKAAELAGNFNLRTAALSRLPEEIEAADIILVATNAERPLICAAHCTGKSNKLIIDLSIPCNVDEGVRALPNVHLVNVDELSKLKDDTLKKRQAEVPKAKEIIAEAIAELSAWYEMRRHVPLLIDLKTKLKTLHTYSRYNTGLHICENTLDTKIQQVVNETAGKIKKADTKGCQYIAAINDFICIA